MLEVPSYRESLESSLQLKEALEKAKTPQEVLYVIYDALHAIEHFDEMPNLEAKINLDNLENTLQEIRDAVTIIFENNVLPKQYAEWLEGARKECEFELWELAGILILLKETTLNDEDDYMQMLAKIHQARKGYSEYRLSHLEHPHDEVEHHPLPIPTANFEPWRQQEIEIITQKMSALRQQMEKIEEHEPSVTTAS